MGTELRRGRRSCRGVVASPEGATAATGRFRWRSVAGVGVLALALPAYGQALAALDDAPQFRDLARDNMHGFLNDLSARRRTTTMFPNPQSVFAGVQENFVKTSTGALTFLVRDLVRVGGMPIVMGRVYDSTLVRLGADLTYAGHRLTSVTDPRTKVVLAAGWADDRIRRIRVLHPRVP